MDRPPETELEAVIDSVMNPPRAPAAANSLVAEVRRLSHEELSRVQALAGADEWFLEGAGQPVGPLTTAQMKERWLAHSIRPDSRCWGVGLPGWTPICRVTALARALGPQPAYPVRAPRPPPPVAEPKAEPKKEALPEAASAPVTDHTRPTRPRPMLREEILYQAALSRLARSANARPASGEAPPPQEPPAHSRYEVVPAPRRRSPQTRPYESSDDLPALFSELARSPRPSREPEDEGAPVSRAANRALRAAVGALIGLSAAAILVALMALPPLLSPPKPRAPAPAPAPVAARQPAPERPVKKDAPGPAPAPARAAARAPAAAAEPQGDPAPVPTADPQTEAAFDRVFGHAEAPAPKPPEHPVHVPPAPPKPRAPRAQLTDADVMAVVTAHKPQLVKCREQARAQDPHLSGRLLVRFTISTDGDPVGVESLLSDLQDTDLDACVTRAIQGWKFPRHTAEQAPITFPFVF